MLKSFWLQKKRQTSPRDETSTSFTSLLSFPFLSFPLCIIPVLFFYISLKYFSIIQMSYDSCKEEKEARRETDNATVQQVEIGKSVLLAMINHICA